MKDSSGQGTTQGKANRVIIIGCLAVCLLFAIGTLLIMFEAAGPDSPPASPGNTAEPGISASPTVPRINIPTIIYPTLTPSAPSYTVSISSTGGSGMTGTATFIDIAGNAAILLHLDGVDEEELVPVELRQGSCANPGEILFPLAPTDAGESETDLSINLEQFNQQRPFAVIVYRSAQDRTVTACGDSPK